MVFVYFVQIREELNLPNVDARVLKTTAAAVEMETKKVVELALKLQKRAKRQTMSGCQKFYFHFPKINVLVVDDINLALSIFHNEHIYGLRRPPTIISVGENGQSDIVQDSSKIDLSEFSFKSLYTCELIVSYTYSGISEKAHRSFRPSGSSCSCALACSRWCTANYSRKSCRWTHFYANSDASYNTNNLSCFVCVVIMC